MANDYEQLAIDLLAPIVAPVGVSTRHGSTAPYLRVRRVGGAASSRVREDVTLVIEWYDRTETAAQAGLEKVRGYLLEAAPSVARTRVIRRVSEMAAPVNLPDPDTPGIERYSMTISLGARRRTTFTP